MKGSYNARGYEEIAVMVVSNIEMNISDRPNSAISTFFASLHDYIRAILDNYM